MSMTADLVDKTVIPVENALHDAGLNKNDIRIWCFLLEVQQGFRRFRIR